MIGLLRKTLFLGLCTLLAVGLTACDEDSLLTETNPNELSAETFYETQAQAEAAVFAVYANLQTIGLYNRRYYFIHDLLSNEAEGMGSLEPDLGQFNTYQVTAGGNPTLSENWKALHRGVQRANLVVQNVPDVPDQQISEDLRQQFIAEARFLRAWHLYELVTLWGDFPLNLNDEGEPVVATQEELNNGVPKVPEEEIYSIILEDLNFAENNLPLKSDYSPANVGRASAAAAAALKGKVHLARSSDGPIGTGANAWGEAEQELGKFVDLAGISNASGDYASEYELVDNYFDNFKEETENNDESIFEVQFAPTGSANWSEQGSGVFEETFRNQEYAFNGWRNVIPSQKLVEEYEDDDPRLGETVYFPGDTWGSGGTVQVPDDLPSWRKYQKTYRSEDNTPSTNSGINFRVIRLAEVYLSLADAKIELGKNQEAIDLMNEVRSRPSVDMPEYPTADYPVSNRQELLDALYHEVAVEHAGEQVLHKFQQRRPQYLEEWATGPEYNPTGLQGDVDAGFELPRSVLMPILQQEIDANNALSADDQNEGY